MVRANCRADGIGPRRLVARSTSPPSTSDITKGAIPPGDVDARPASSLARLPGAVAPNSRMPPAADAISPRTLFSDDISAGTTITCHASLPTLQDSRADWFEHAGVGDGVTVAAGGAVGLVAIDAVAVPDCSGPAGRAAPPQAAGRTIAISGNAHLRRHRRPVAVTASLSSANSGLGRMCVPPRRRQRACWRRRAADSAGLSHTVGDEEEAHVLRRPLVRRS